MKETGQLRAWNVIQAELWSPLSVCIRRLQVQLRQTEHVHQGHHRNMQRLDAESWQLSPRQEYMVICCPPGMPQLCPLTLQLSPSFPHMHTYRGRLEITCLKHSPLGMMQCVYMLISCSILPPSSLPLTFLPKSFPSYSTDKLFLCSLSLPWIPLQ